MSFDASLPSVVEVFAKQVLSKESDMVGFERVQATAKIHL